MDSRGPRRRNAAGARPTRGKRDRARAPRAELVGVEIAEERERLTAALRCWIGGAVIVAFAVLLAGLFVIAVFWDTHRLGAIAAWRCSTRSSAAC